MRIFIFTLLLLGLTQIAQANPFCQIPEGERDAVAAFACTAARRVLACALVGEIGGIGLERGRPVTQEEIQNHLDKPSDILPKIPLITNREQYSDAINDCIAESTAKVDPLFQKAKNQLQDVHNKEALVALKELYAYWITTMNAIFLTRNPGVSLFLDPQLDERIIGIFERSNRLKVEL